MASHGVETPIPVADGLQLLTVTEVADLLHLSGQAVRYLCRSGALPGAYRLGDGPKARYRIPSSAVARFMRDASAESEVR